MGSSITFLVRHFLNHPEHRFLLYKRVILYPRLAEQFEAIQLDTSVEPWLQWFALFERVAPEHMQEIAQETSALLYGSSPDLDAFPPEAEGEPTVVEENQPLFEPLGAFAPSAEDSVRATNREKKKMASRNSQMVYGSPPGWCKFKLEMKTGEVLPVDGIGEIVRPLHCKLVEDDDGKSMEEMRLYISEHRILSYHERKWFWQNTSKTRRKLRMDIKDISKVLKADVVDMLLDLVLPGLFLQAADAYLSVSVAPEAEQEAEESRPEASAVQQGPMIGPSGAMARSPFAVRPLDPDAETTLVRKAIIEPNTQAPPPKELTVHYTTAPSRLGEWLGLQPKPQPLHTLQINETHHIETLGLNLTFTIESTPTSVFPWVRVERSGHVLTDAHMSLRWNQEQYQSLPPNFKSTGALSRRPELGELLITIQSSGHRDQWLTVRWKP